MIVATSKRTLLPPEFLVDDIPPELLACPRWVGWRYKHESGRKKPSKPPIDPHTGRKADSTDPRTWGTFDAANRMRQSAGLDGLGFVLGDVGDGLPFAGVDLDDVIDPLTGAVDPWAEEVVARLASYTEISPSGTGLKVFGRGRLVDGLGHWFGDCPHVELYDKSRYFTVTGAHLADCQSTVADVMEELQLLQTELAAAMDRKRVAREHGTPCASVHLRDTELIDKAHRARNGQLFGRLWSGDWQCGWRYATRSHADLALAGLLAFWVGPDQYRLVDLLRQSWLCRDKFHRADYLARTAKKAIAGTLSFYSPSSTSPHQCYKSVNPLQFAWKLATESTPAAVEQFDNGNIRQLAALCWHLQRIKGDSPFAIDCRSAGLLLGVSHVSASRYFHVLLHVRFIVEITKGQYAATARTTCRATGSGGLILSRPGSPRNLSSTYRCPIAG